MNVKLLLVFAVMILAIPLSAQNADIAGAWKAEFDTQIGIQKYVFEFKQTDTGLSGAASSDIGGEKQVAPLTEIKLDSNRFHSSRCCHFRERNFASVIRGRFLETR